METMTTILIILSLANTALDLTIKFIKYIERSKGK